MQPKFSNEFVRKDVNENRSFSADSVIEKRPLGEGKYGEVYQVTVTKDGIAMDFAIKDYSKNEYDARKLTEQAYDHYLKAKEAGLKVFPTVRISSDKPQLLLTLGTTADQTLISKDSHVTWDKVNTLSNMKELVSGIGMNVLKGSRAGMKMRRDIYFFLVNNVEPTKADFLIGDYERPIDSGKTPDALFKRNMQSAKGAIDIFIEKYVSPDKQVEYKEQAAKEIEQFEKDHLHEIA